MHWVYDRWHFPHMVHSLHTNWPHAPVHLYLLPLAGVCVHVHLDLQLGRGIPRDQVTYSLCTQSKTALSDMVSLLAS